MWFPALCEIGPTTNQFSVDIYQIIAAVFWMTMPHLQCTLDRGSLYLPRDRIGAWLVCCPYSAPLDRE
jgi:hypothetical protein